MNCTYTDLDDRNYQRRTDGQISVESRMNDKGEIELSLSDKRGSFVVLKLNSKEAAAVSAAAIAGGANCTSTILVGEPQKDWRGRETTSL